uniref:Diacylglycerol kinase type I N-terminal domain-containing protein n=1 Tax=Laticauda laticaudata TaxID=8630 RepID=A0A8C5SSZ7_LATLA
MMKQEKWANLSPSEFSQLQKYAEYSTKKIKDVLDEFHGNGVLTIDLQDFKLFMKTFLEADLPVEFCEHLFVSLGNKAHHSSPLVNNKSPFFPGRDSASARHPLGFRSPSASSARHLLCIHSFCCASASLCSPGSPADVPSASIRFHPLGFCGASELENIITQMMHVAEWDVLNGMSLNSVQ